MSACTHTKKCNCVVNDQRGKESYKINFSTNSCLNSFCRYLTKIMALSKRKARALSIKEKVMVIQQKESEGKSQRELAKIFGVSKTQIQKTLKRKADVLAAYDDNLPNDRKRVRIFEFKKDTNSLTFRWFQRARSLNLPISGPLIQKKALSFSKSLKKDSFKASSGWLNRF